MKNFQEFCEAITVGGARQGVSDDARTYGMAAWKGLEEVKNLLELLAQYDPGSFNSVVTRLRQESLQLLRQKGVPVSDAESIKQLLKSVSTDSRRFANKAQSTIQNNQGEQQ